MSITKNFEERLAHGLPMYPMAPVDELLAHTRALEAMLKKREWHTNDEFNETYCKECGGYHPDSVKPFFDDEPHFGHKPDCPLAKLLEGV